LVFSFSQIRECPFLYIEKQRQGLRGNAALVCLVFYYALFEALSVLSTILPLEAHCLFPDFNALCS